MSYLVSAGHGGTDPGACANGYREADIAMDMRERVATRLLELRHSVLMDGGKGVNLPLAQAVALVKGTDLAVELHCNAAANLQATGVEVIALPARKPIAQRIARAIAAETGQPLRGQCGWIDQSQSQHSKLAFVQAGGLIVEMVFISNRSDLLRFLDVRDKVAQAIAAAMCGNAVGVPA
jgi:N-acetylmuramoyl-L-alanine amidase